MATVVRISFLLCVPYCCTYTEWQRTCRGLSYNTWRFSFKFEMKEF
jgi:hypothetical protein